MDEVNSIIFCYSWLFWLSVIGGNQYTTGFSCKLLMLIMPVACCKLLLLFATSSNLSRGFFHDVLGYSWTFTTKIRVVTF